MNALAKRAVSERELLLTRVFDAPVELVWQAWTQKPHLEKWLAPHTVTIVHAQVDLRVGGRWRLRVRFPGGAKYWVGGVYREIVPNERIVSTETYEGLPEGVSEEDGTTVNTATFTESSDGRTTLTILVQAPSKETRDAIIESGMEAGMQDALDLLEEVAISLR